MEALTSSVVQDLFLDMFDVQRFERRSVLFPFLGETNIVFGRKFISVFDIDDQPSVNGSVFLWNGHGRSKNWAVDARRSHAVSASQRELSDGPVRPTIPRNGFGDEHA